MKSAGCSSAERKAERGATRRLSPSEKAVQAEEARREKDWTAGGETPGGWGERGSRKGSR